MRHRPGLGRGLTAVVLTLSLAGLAAQPGSPNEAPDDDVLAMAPEVARSCDLDTTSTGTHDADRRALMGLAAHVCGDSALAVELLEPGAAATVVSLEDWRLFILAQAAVEIDELGLAGGVADRLLLDHPDSPLRHRAFVLRTRIAQLAGESDRALSMARASRATSFPSELRNELDVLAWEAAGTLGRSIDIYEEALQLLLTAPLEALELEVEEVLREPDGSIQWREHFESNQLLLRADRLLEVDLIDEALETLDHVPSEERDLDWHFVRSRALVEDRRGSEALTELEGLSPHDQASALDLAWLKADASLDAATARRGRTNLPSAARDEMRRSALDHLRHIMQRGGDSARAMEAAQRLFEELADGEHFDEVQSILEHLQKLDPSDTTGTRYLWKLGWGEYARRNYSGAIGYWAELMALYPPTKSARTARYWSGRAHEALGNRERARSIYEQIAAAPTTDYYRKHALLRLGGEPVPDETPRIGDTLEWPSDPLLERAELLSDLGIDQLGLEELELLAPMADRRATNALRSRILARQGRRRESIQNLWRVFPVLGTSGQVAVPDDALRMYYPVDFLDIVERFADDNALPVPLLLAMIRQESAFDIQARSWAGARGLMQLMPATAKELAQRMGLPYSSDRLSDPAYSVQLGSRYFRQVLDMFDGDLELALAGYNAGPYRIRRLVQRAGPDLEPDTFLESLTIEESKTYVKRVVLFADSYQRLYPDLG